MADILGLTGPPGSGKDTIANLLVETGKWRKVAFADPVREALWVMNPAIVDERIPGGFDDYQNLVEQHGYDTAKRRYPEIRRLLRSFATDAVRNIIDPDAWTRIWLERTYNEIEHGYNVVAPDVRFQNEIDTIRNGPGEARIARVIRSARPQEGTLEKLQGQDTTEHESEALANAFAGDFPIYNRGGMSELRGIVRALAASLAEQVSN